MRLMLLLLLGISASSCIPPRPKLDFCVVDADVPNCHCSNGSDHKYDLSLKECDKFVALSPRDSEAAMAYIIQLEKALTAAQRP